VRRVAAGSTLRVQAQAPFVLRTSQDGWNTSADIFSTPTKLGIHYVDVRTAREGHAPIQFTFYWPETGSWEGSDFRVELETGAAEKRPHLHAVNA